MDNIDTSDVCSLLVPEDNEDSVDIYAGLDISPRRTAEKSSPDSSQLKESMDLYEEIVTEENQSKESSYSELQTRFQAAQNQIKELRRRLEQMELQNTGLNTENFRLKKNISALLRTAKMEVTRKDAEIQRLNQQSEKGRYHHHSHNNLRDQNVSRQTSTGSSKSRPLPPPPSSALPPPPPSSYPPLRPPLPSSPPRQDQPSQVPLKPLRKESDSSTSQPSGSIIEIRTSKASSNSHSQSSSREKGDAPDKQTDPSVRKSSSCASTRHSESDKHKYKHRDEKFQKLSESTGRRHRTGSDPDKDRHPSENRSHKADRGRRYDSSSSKSRNHLFVDGHHRSERANSPPPEILYSMGSSDDKKGRIRERRQDKTRMSTSDSDHSASHISKEGYSRDHGRIKTSERHSSDSNDWEKSSLKQHTESYRDSSKERKGDRLSKGHHRKEDRHREDKISRKHQRNTSSERSREHEKQKSKESEQGNLDVCNQERKEKTQEALKGSSQEANTTEKSSVEENSPNRKLCFMETLNLTLSPIKKPVLPTNTSHSDLTKDDKDVENEFDDDESSQPNVEDICVIDEVNSSELGARLEDVAERCPDISKTPGSEKTQRCDDVKDVQEKEENRSITPAANKQHEDHLVQSTSGHCQPKSPESSVLKASNGDISKSCKDKTKPASENQATDIVSDTFASLNGKNTSSSLQKVNPKSYTDQSIVVTEPVVLDSNAQHKHKNLLMDSVKEKPAAENVPDKAKQNSPTLLPQDKQHGQYPPPSSSPHEKDADAVSSTISLESLPHEALSLPEAIYILTQTREDGSDSSGIVTEPSSSTGCIAVSKVSSTTEETTLPDKYNELNFTPKKSFSPGKSHENKASSSVPVFHDEDSMMRTLSNLKRIPDVISPLRSPIRITKRNHAHVLGKPGHVKSLEKDFSSTPVDANSKKLDVNKENKYPGSPANHDTQNVVDKVSDLPSCPSDTELEEGEILSESDETATGSPVPATKRVKLALPVRNKQSPNTLSKRTSKEGCVTSKETNEKVVPTRSPKSRFKTVCPAATKASFSTIEDVMETFKLVRAEIRKKYMKLHKTFPKKSFYGVMDNFRESFLEFVDGAQFGQISNEQRELKSKLKKLIISVFGKVSNNGIVKRIFEQQAVDLKQKLWDFVDVQVEYLFRDVYTMMNSLCKPKMTRVEDSKPSANENVSRPPVKKPQCQQKDAQPAPTNLKQVKPSTQVPSSVVPYRTGLGSRGKDIRITHEPHPTNCSNTQTVVNFLPPRHIHSTPEKNNISSLVVSQNGSLLDKTDFELLTEQQASSLTFNLVRDTQMGEIFKCLLQGSDLLESTGITGDNTTWSLGTPRKDGERFISITTPTKFDSPSKLLSPTKFETPSKLIATWSSISPRKISSPRSKDLIPLNPALFDESCLLEVPDKKAMLQSNLASQRSYSILAEDLAVSLTIPSPLKSDSHLSFLQPSSMHIMSTPDSVISAHISEDALLDGEDASEQDIHLALDTDISSCSSSSSTASEVLATPFLFKPDLPMQALVMERSNDHFIVKIRQAATAADTTLTADDSLSRTLTEDDHQHREDSVVTQDSQGLTDKSNGTPSNAVPSKINLSESTSQEATVADIHLPQAENLTLTKDPYHKEEYKSTQQNTSNVCLSQDTQKRTESPKNLPGTSSLVDSDVQKSGELRQATSRESNTVIAKQSPTCRREEDTITQECPKKESNNSPHHSAESPGTNQVLTSSVSDSERGETELSDSGRSFTCAKDGVTPEKDQRDCGKGHKRKKHQEKSKAKRSRKEEGGSTEETVSDCKNDISKSPPTSPSSSLNAKNVIRKKGEVVISWTRDEDRAILIALKTKGPSRETFSALSEKLDKPSGQVAHRFYQLMKLYKKQEKMDP